MTQEIAKNRNSTLEWNNLKGVLHDEHNVIGFFGKYKFLDNFYIDIFGYAGNIFPSAENAYRAMRVKEEHREFFCHCSPQEAKENWTNFPLIYRDEEWNSLKEYFMFDIVKRKFQGEGGLGTMLVKECLDKNIVALNFWGDCFWGVNPQMEGQNKLGNIIMAICRLKKENLL